jgi:calcineurin-like phosphoesterase family protein
MTQVFFTSDCHFDHANIIKFCDRPFWRNNDLVGEGKIASRVWVSDKRKIECCQWMNETLVKKWNSKVKNEDIIYHIGDFAFKGSNNTRKWEEKLNGSIVHIQGNHDLNNGVKTFIVKCIMEFGNKSILVQHHPPHTIQEIPEWCDFVLCGHVHDKWKHKVIEGIPIINVGVDVWDFEPVSVESILKYFHLVKNNLVNEKGERI